MIYPKRILWLSCVLPVAAASTARQSSQPPKIDHQFGDRWHPFLFGKRISQHQHNSHTVPIKAEYEWPSNLYLEARDMAAASFLVYTFGYMLEAARRHSDSFKGLHLEQGRITRGTGSALVFRTKRTFRPKDIAALIRLNADLLAETHSSFRDVTAIVKSLKLLSRTVNGRERSVSLHEYDDRHQKHEPVYAVAVDDVKKRITLVFRGTDNALAFSSNWKTNCYMIRKKVPLPKALKGKVPVNNLKIHKGYHGYLFADTYDDTDDPDKIKYDEILEDIKPLLKAHPDYKLYVTGHSLGGAMAGLAAFYLTCEESVPKPVTCITFGAPRFGDSNTRLAFDYLQRSKQLRMCRFVNDHDTVAAVPLFGYKHVGFQVRLHKNSCRHTELSYPKLTDYLWRKIHFALKNSFSRSLNLGYDHSDYRQRVEDNAEFLKQHQLDNLYWNSTLAWDSI